jgi:hypothetical protein
MWYQFTKVVSWLYYIGLVLKIRVLALHIYKIVKLKCVTQDPKPRSWPLKVKFSAEAKARWKVGQKNSQVKYQVNPNKSWDLIDETITIIAETHGKSFQCVQFMLHMGQRKDKWLTSAWNAYL